MYIYIYVDTYINIYMFIYTIYMKEMRSSAFPYANVHTLVGTRSMTVTGIEPPS